MSRFANTPEPPDYTVISTAQLIGQPTGGDQVFGREHWYSHYELRIARVERTRSGPEGRGWK